MAIGTFTQAVRLVNAGSARAVPDVLPERHVFTQHRFPFIGDFINVSAPTLGPGQIEFQRPGKIKSKVTHQLQPKLYDFGSLPTSFEASGANAAITADNDETVTFVGVSGLKKYDLLKSRATGAVIQVRSVSSTTVTFRAVTGGANNDGLDSIVAGHKFDKVGSAYPDGATINTGTYNEPTERSNYLQFHVNEVDLGILAERRRLFPDNQNGADTDELTQAILHNEGRERAFLFGEASLGTIASETIHTMKGLEGWSDLEYDAGGTMTMDKWRTVVMPNVTQAGGGGTIKAVTGNTVLSVFDALLEQNVRSAMGDSVLGVNVSTIKSNLGTVTMMGSEPMNERDGEVFFYRPELMTRMYLEGLDMVLMTDLAPNNILKKTSAWMTCETLLVHNPDSIVKYTNILA